MRIAFNILCLVWSAIMIGASVYFKRLIRAEEPRKVPVHTVVTCLNWIFALGCFVGIVTLVYMFRSIN